MRKPAPLRCAGLHNLLPVIWRLYFNRLTKLNIQFLKTNAESTISKYMFIKLLINKCDKTMLVIIRSVTDVLRAQSRFVKFVTFYKPTLGPKYVSNRLYNKFITPTTFIWRIIGIFNWFPLSIFNVGYTLDSKYAVTWRQFCDAIGWS